MAKGLKPTPQPDLDRLLQDIGHLASICDATTSGSTRRVFSPEYVAGREFVARRMGDAGLDTSYDGVGNLIGTRSGESGALVTGSHTDTVDGGGKLDGVLGVLGAIEAIRSLDEAGIQLNHELRVLDFLGEEPNDWGISCIGSRGLAGELGAYELGCLSPDGTTLEAALAAFGIRAGPATSTAWSQGEIHAFVELHIEQGPVLEQANIPIGVVTGIAEASTGSPPIFTSSTSTAVATMREPCQWPYATMLLSQRRRQSWLWNPPRPTDMASGHAEK